MSNWPPTVRPTAPSIPQPSGPRRRRLPRSFRSTVSSSRTPRSIESKPCRNTGQRRMPAADGQAAWSANVQASLDVVRNTSTERQPHLLQIDLEAVRAIVIGEIRVPQNDPIDRHAAVGFLRPAFEHREVVGAIVVEGEDDPRARDLHRPQVHGPAHRCPGDVEIDARRLEEWTIGRTPVCQRQIGQVSTQRDQVVVEGVGAEQNSNVRTARTPRAVSARSRTNDVWMAIPASIARTIATVARRTNNRRGRFPGTSGCWWSESTVVSTHRNSGPTDT